MKALGFAAVLLSFGVAAACTVSSETDSGEGGSSATSTTTTTTTSSVTTSSTSVTSTSSTGMMTCADEATADACLECCSTENEAGSNNLTVFLFENCSCAMAAPCATQCNTDDPATDLCADDGTLNPNIQELSMECGACVNGLIEAANGGMQPDACLIAAVEACNGDADCSALFDCQRSCP